MTKTGAGGWGRGVSVPALLVSLIMLAACVKPKPLEVLGDVPLFQLTASDGQTFESKSLAGHNWVADFIYTTCDGPCPMMSAQMRRIQDSTASEMADVKFVSITVDPAHDTAPVLAAYAKHFKCDPTRWTFLTGDKDKLNEVGLAFKLQSIDGSLTHSTRFVLVDRHMRIRGYYTTGEDGFMPRLMHDIRQLEADKS
jgi:protein SCO1